MDSCTFCKITQKKILSELVLENDQVIAFHNIHPSAETHILIVPKKHIGTVLDLKESDSDLFFKMISTAQDLVKKNNLDKMKYRLVINGGLAQHVAHLHLHLLGGDLVGVPE